MTGAVVPPRGGRCQAGGAGGMRRREGAGAPPATTSLPPLVRGPPRCFLRCTVPRVVWAAPKPPVLVRLRWWGETSGGTLFQPASRPGHPAGRTTARFPVRCGPRQLAAYLADMGVLVLEVLTKLDHLPIGRVQITKLSQLSPSHPIKGSFPLMSPTSAKLGELQVSLALEPLPEVYDTSTTTEGSLDPAPAQGSSKSQLIAPSPQPRHTQVAGADPESVDNSKATSPRGKDHLLFQENSENMKDTSASYHLGSLADESWKMNPSNPSLLFPPSTNTGMNTRMLSTHSPATKDLLSALLDQGRKLRDAMVVSAMKSSPDVEIELNKVVPFIEREDFKASTKSPEGLKSSLVPPSVDFHRFESEVSEHQLDLNSEERAIQLLLGSADFSPGHLWDRTGSLWDSLSLESEVYDSELGDPHYDQSLLERLFYTAPKYDSSLSDSLSDDDVKSSNKASKTETLRKSNPANPQKDFNAFDQSVTEIKPSCSPTAPPEDHREAAHVTSLDSDMLAFLQQIHLARVIIDSLKIPLKSIQIFQRKKTLMGKPPQPASVDKCTFFVEYHFPMGVSKDDKGQISIKTEVIRVASSKITDDGVKFQQRSVFPVRFGGKMIEHWWDSDLAFKIYMRKSTQKKPMAIGSAVLQLRRVIQARLLSVSWEIPVEKEGDHPQVGPLMGLEKYFEPPAHLRMLPISWGLDTETTPQGLLELAADNKDFTCTTARSAPAGHRVPAHAVRSPQLEFQESSSTSANAEGPHYLRISSEDSQKAGVGNRKVVAQDVLTQITPSEEVLHLLHVLLMVPDGKDFVAGDKGLPSSCNVYLNCKLLSTEGATRSAVAWGATQPAFNFCQVMPFPLSPKRLERLKDNVMIIEAWNKLGSTGCDRLLGLVKLPLHQFYISFKDPKVSHLLLQAQYPVVAVDSYMPVVDVFTGSTSGSLRVILAMGSADQIVALQRLKNGEGVVPSVPQRPSHSLDPPPTKPTTIDPEGEDLMEHVFEIHVESVKGLTPLQSTVWGEADCYIQYHFPVQEAGCAALQGPELHEDGIKLKPFRTATTLCVPDPIFNDEHHHSLVVPADVPVQRLLVNVFMAPGVAGGGIQFEVWCRYYYPNVRDQLVAKGTLPLSRLCAMVTMQHREEIGIQTFNLPLVPRPDSLEEFHPQSSGLLDVSVRYQRSMKKAGITAQAVSLSVHIHRAAGLQAAARAVAQKNPAVQYYAGVGVNSYVSVLLSFLPEAETQTTQAVAGTFCPEFEHHVEFLCNPVIQKSSGESSSLGELLQSGNIIFSIYHQSTKSVTDRLADRASRDYLLGTVTIPTRDLLTRRSGISGWFPVTLSSDPMPPHCTNITQAIVGGLELSVTFAHWGDRERVLDAAKLLGWSSEEIHGDSTEESKDWELSANPVTVTISTPKVWLPLHCVLLTGQAHLDKSTFCYLRYKLYNQEATWTWLRRPKLSGDAENVTVNFKKPNKVTLRRSQGLLWFFREEKLEIQVWWAYGKKDEVERPLDTDRLVGSAYVNLAALAERSRTTLSVSGVYPLFRCNAADLAGAAVRVHVSLAPAPAALPSRIPCAQECSSSEDEGTRETPDLSQQVPENQQLDIVSPGITGGKPQEEDVMFLENTVGVNILVERAMHLSLKGSPLTEREVRTPSSCVSFAVAGADAPVTTPVIENTDSPIWDFQEQARLSKELLLDPQQTLVFKVWHKAETERVIGFASVDLSPLLSGFQIVCGWYNITDFSGQCRGQIKVAISPLQNINHLKEERQARARTQPESSSGKASFLPFPGNAANFSKQMLNSLSKELAVPTQERISTPGAHTPRHEEHMQNVRRFHESLQQEGNMRRAARLDSASPSSRASLLTALRKNLNELDEVQRYFSQKLTRSFPDFSYDNTSKPSHEEQERDHQGSLSREVDPKGCHLLEKSSQLVSQVSSLINDLQTITKNSKEASNVHPDSSRKPSAVDASSWKEEGARQEVHQGRLGLDSPRISSDPQQPSSSGRPVFERHMLHELLDPIVPEDEHPMDYIREDEGAFAIQPHSEEEYEEDIIEPQTLNEITTITDRMSPWSSVISETGQGAEQHSMDSRPGDQHSVDVGCFQRRTSILQGDNQSELTTLSPSVSLHAGGNGNSPWEAVEGFQSFNSGTETGQKEHLQPAGQSFWSRAFNSEPRKKNVEVHAGSKALLPFPGDMGLINPKTTGREEEESAEDLNEERHDKEGIGSDENCVRSVSTQAGSERNSESFPDDSSEDPLDGSENSIKPKLTLSDPVIVPNFFLPTQEMEASMRLLSTSSHPSTVPKERRSGAMAEGIPYRRPNHPKPTPSLSEEETQRIARIFSAQLSKKE